MKNGLDYSLEETEMKNTPILVQMSVSSSKTEEWKAPLFF